MPPIEDTDLLLDQAAAGDVQAMNRLFDRHRSKLRRMVEMRMDKRLAQRCDASDVVQESLLNASQALPSYTVDRSIPFYPWLREIARNKLIDLHRRHVQTSKRSVSQETPIAGDLSEYGHQQLVQQLVSSQASPSQQVVAMEQNRRVRELLGEMDKTDREVLVLRYLEQLTNREAAGVLGMNENAYSQRHLRAIRRLRKLLDDGGSNA